VCREITAEEEAEETEPAPNRNKHNNTGRSAHAANRR
jgi:hypothetical protein